MAVNYRIVDVIDEYPPSVAKKVLRRHAAAFEAKCKQTAVDCSRVQASLLRRTLLHGIASSKESMFGIPRPFPKVLALLHLSGDYAMLYSANTDLLRVILKCLIDPYRVNLYLETLESLIKWGDDQKNLNVCYLLTGVLPWQEGLGSCHFEVRTVVVDDKNGLCDGQKLVSSGLIGVRDGSPTVEPHGSAVGIREVKALASDVWAVCVDKSENIEEEETASTVASTANATDREKALRAIADQLRDQRQKLEAEVLELKSAEQSRLAEATTQIESRSNQTIVQAQKVKNLCNQKMKDAEERISKAMQNQLSAQKELADAKREAANQFLIQRAAVEAAEKQKKVVSAASQCTIKQNTELSKKVEELTKELRDAKDKYEHAVSTEVHKEVVLRDEALVKVRNADATIQKLGDVLDRRDNEAAVLNSELHQCRKQLAECNEELQTSMEKARLYEARCTNEEHLRKRQLLKNDMEKKRLIEELRSIKLKTGQQVQAPSSKKEVSTNTFGTDTFVDTMVQSKATQTAPFNCPHEPVSTPEVCKAASVALDRLIRIAQMPNSVYNSAFHGHISAPVFKPAALYMHNAHHSPHPVVFQYPPPLPPSPPTFTNSVSATSSLS